MKKNQFFVNYLTLTFCFFVFYGVAQAQPSCSQSDWCRHQVEIKNSSCCEVEIWCQEIGCDGQDYYMGKLESGKTFWGDPSAYGAKFKVAHNGSFLHEFPQLDIDGYCYGYNFEYKGSGSACSKPVLQTSEDQHICAGQSVEICADGADGYWWSNGKDKRCITVSPSRTKTFTVLGKRNGCESNGEVTVNVNESFGLETSGDQHICAGQSVEICADGADGYWWSNGKDKRCITVSPSHTETYTVLGKRNGCEAYGTVTVNVSDQYRMPSSDDQHICAGQSVEICGEGADSYLWGNGKQSACITVSPNQTKTYTVVGEKNGCEDTDYITVNVNGSFSLQTTGDQHICAGQSVEICADGADGYWWSNGKDKRCITVSPSQTKTFTVLGKKNGCEAEAHITINVNDKFSIPSSADYQICAGQSVEICADSSDSADNYYWNNGENRRCITVSPHETTTYSVTGSKNGCEDSDHIKVNVNGSFNLGTSDDQTICAGQSVEICADGADGYWWSNGKDKRCITVSPHDTKTYSVIGIKNGCEAEGKVTVNVNGSFNLGTSDDQTICAGQSVEICANGADGYWWSNGKDKRCITVSPHDTKTYSVIGKKNGCEAEGHVTVNVNGSFNLGTSDDQTICAGQSVEICANGADGYWWSNGKDKRCITVSPHDTKTYSVIGKKNGCEAEGKVTVHVNGSFNLGTSDDQSICAGQSVEICANGADGYWWSNGKDKRCITVSPDHTKTYSVIGKKNGCEGSGEVTVHVNGSFNLGTSDDQTICAGQSVEICANGADGYWWSNGKDKRCITVSPDHTKTYSVTGKKNGCEGSGEVTVHVNDSFNLHTDGDQTIHKGQSIEICASGADAYWWSNGKDKRCITVSPDHTKTYSVTGVKNGCEGSGEVTVHVNEDNTCSIDDIRLEEWSVSKHDAVLAWTEYANVWYTLYIREVGDKWYQFETDYADVELSNLNPCTKYEWAISVKCSNGQVSDACDIRSFTTLGHCNGRVANTEAIGFNQSVEKVISVYPNPATNLLTIDYKNIPVKQSAIYNSVGKLVEYVDVDASGISIVKVEDYTSGVYLIIANANDKLYKNVFVVD